MASDEGEKMMRAASEGGPRQFVNHLQVSLSLSEFRFDLAALGDSAGSPRGPQQGAPVWRFTTAPDHMAAMYRRLGLALDTYRTRYTAIEGPPDNDDDAPATEAPNG